MFQRGHNSLDIARAERNTTVLEILLESVSVPPSGAVYYHMPSTLSDRVGTGSERALKDSEPTSGAVHYHLPSTLSDRTGLDGGDVRSRDSSAFRRVISLESDEYGKRSQLRNSWISNEYEVSAATTCYHNSIQRIVKRKVKDYLGCVDPRLKQHIKHIQQWPRKNKSPIIKLFVYSTARYNLN